MKRIRVQLPCGCVQVVRINPAGTCLGRRVRACGPGGVHDGFRWPPFGVLLEEALRCDCGHDRASHLDTGAGPCIHGDGDDGCIAYQQEALA